jgi:hypothetical protein
MWKLLTGKQLTMKRNDHSSTLETRITDLERALASALCDVGFLKGEADKSAHRLQSLEGSNVKRDSESEPDAEPPYRMAEPPNCDALVIDNGKVWRPVFGPDGIWEADDDSDWVVWEVLTDPQPFQNCTLTADDPEPPIGSVVHHDGGTVSKRYPSGWLSIGLEYSFILWEQEAINSVTLLYRGEG